MAPDVAEAGSLLFNYPLTNVTLSASGYSAPRVLLEFGSRSDHWPEEPREIRPYAAEAFPDEFDVPSFEVRTLHIHRTFWEKATILHSLAYGGPKKIRPRMARHYYDLVRMADSDEGASTIENRDLLRAVAEHKQRFFASAWASYETAVPGTLRLVPSEEVVKDLRRDYELMSPLFMEDPPAFGDVITRLGEIEAQVNRVSSAV